MIDWFGRKAKARIAKLEEDNAYLHILNRKLSEQWALSNSEHNSIAKAREDNITKLVRSLRELDQLIYQMQTSGSADQLRSAVNRAWAITEVRMKAESARIEALLIPEIIATYSDQASLSSLYQPQEAALCPSTTKPPQVSPPSGSLISKCSTDSANSKKTQP